MTDASRFAPDFSKLDGLVTAVVVGHASGEVLMVAFMNDEALRLTRETGEAHYYSRSRQRLWKKGESSGNTQRVREMRVDCDQDAIVLVVEQQGPACHEGFGSCFFRTVLPSGELATNQSRQKDPREMYGN